MAAADQQRLAKFLPVLVVSVIIIILYSIYLLYHCFPLLQFEVPIEFRDEYAKHLGVVRIIILHILTFFFLWSFVRTLLTDPGRVPDTGEWNRSPNEAMLVERKKDGSLRYCFKCKRYKPDRSHHSSAGGRCVLRMDHYCPWVANEVGFLNYKYFFLTLVYGCVTLFFIALTTTPTVAPSFNNPNVPFEEIFFLFLGVALAWLMVGIIGPFLLFHVWLCAINSTTIEYCEKRRSGVSYSYDKGIWANFKSILGSNIFLWPFPVSGPDGSGLYFKEGVIDASNA